MDHEQLAAGGAAIRGHQAQGLGEFNDFVTVTEAAAAATTEVSGARSEDQRPRQASGNFGPHSGTVHTGATTASAAAARTRQREDSKARDFREFDEFVKMQMQQQQQPQTQTQQRLTRLQQPPSRSTPQQPPSRSTAERGGGGEVAPAPASPDLDLRL